MSYLALLAIFLAAPAVLLAVHVGRRAAHEEGLRSILRVGVPTLLILILVSACWTAPWDKWMIDEGVFVYPPAKVAAWVDGVPVEDLLLFALQGLLAGLWAMLVIGRAPARAVAHGASRGAARLAVTGGLVAALVTGLLLRSPHALYVSSILAWFGPLLAVQFAAGTGVLMVQWRWWVAAVAPTTLWLWVAELVAIRQGIWWIDPEHSAPFRPAGLPLEDLLIFLVGNMLVVQTMVFVADPAMRARARAWVPTVHIGRAAPARPAGAARPRDREDTE
jgi:lycopene beta-cyclase